MSSSNILKLGRFGEGTDGVMEENVAMAVLKEVAPLSADLASLQVIEQDDIVLANAPLGNAVKPSIE